MGSLGADRCSEQETGNKGRKKNFRLVHFAPKHRSDNKFATPIELDNKKTKKIPVLTFGKDASHARYVDIRRGLSHGQQVGVSLNRFWCSSSASTRSIFSRKRRSAKSDLR